jgi:hypothetical protein
MRYRKEQASERTTSAIGLTVVAVVAVLAVVVLAVVQSRHEQTKPVGEPEPSRSTHSTVRVQRGDEARTTGRLVQIPAGRGVVSNVTLDTATAKPGGPVEATGSVAMPPGESGNVAVSVSWVDAKTSSVYARGLAVLRGLRPGETKMWAVDADLPAGARDITTVLSAVLVE